MASLNAKFSNIFDISQIRANIKNTSVKAGIANLSTQGFSFGLTIFRAAILSRLLSPDDYGLFGMVIFVVSFALIFKDLGLATATIRAKDINHNQVSNLFWINTFIGLISMLIVIGISPTLVWFYHDDRLLDIGIVLSLSFIFSGLSIQHEALLKRQMKFGKIGFISISSAVASSILGLILAWSGYRYWALVWMNVSMNFFLCLGYWIASGWRPALPKKNSGTRKFLNIGFDVAGLNAFATITQNLDKIIVGKIAVPSILGFYTKGNQVPDMITGQIRMAFFSVALPALSSLQSDINKFQSYYYKFLSFIGWSTMPLAMFCFLFSDEIIILYFGKQWIDSSVFMKIFSFKAFFMPSLTTLDQIPLSLGYSKRYLTSGLLRSIASILFVITGTFLYGVKGAALGISIVDAVVFLPYFFICTKGSGVQLSAYLKSVIVPALLTLLIGSFIYISKSQTPYINICTFFLEFITYFFMIGISFLLCDYFGIGSEIGFIKELLLKINKKILKAK